MNYLKRLLLVFLGLILVAVLVSFFFPSSFQLERAIVIKANPDIIFKQVNDLKKWGEWSPWAEKDPTIYIQPESFSANTSGVGAKFTWKSSHDEVGEGHIEIIESIPNNYVQYLTDFGMGETKGSFKLAEQEDGVLVVWDFKTDFGFNPVAKFIGLFMEDYVAPDYERGLERLKSYTENLPQINSSIVAKKYLAKPQWFLSIRDTIQQQQMNNIHGKLYTEINGYMDDNQILSDLPPIVIYHYWSDSIVDIEAGIQINDSLLVTSERIKLNKIDTGNVVAASHYGSYERLPETYFSINEWMRKNQVEVTGPPWEIYVTDPAMEPNPDKWETQIYFPIK